MTPKVQVGTILIEERPLIAQVLGLESEPYSGNWSVIKGLDGFSLDRKIHTAGWNFFFIATEVKVMIFGAIGATNIHSALKRILEKVRQQNFNCFEVTGIVAKRFLGVPYATVSGHSRHIQQSCVLGGVQERQTAQSGRLEVVRLDQDNQTMNIDSKECETSDGNTEVQCQEGREAGAARSRGSAAHTKLRSEQ
jgi:hypothetical protein